MTTGRPVVVKQLPEQLTAGHAQQFLEEVEPQLGAERPYLVFDGSELTHLDSDGVRMLLHCMEEVIKRNGDLKLAAIPPGPAVILELTRVDRLFETFENARDAVESFYRLPSQSLLQTQHSSSLPNTSTKPADVEVAA
jgi:anti-sigma B factor antagonist